MTSRDYPKFREIEKYANIKMERIDLPTKGDLERESMENLFDRVSKNILKAEDNVLYSEVLNKLLAQGHSLYDISASLLKMVNESSKTEKLLSLIRLTLAKNLK